jgi:acyl dehydratase
MIEILPLHEIEKKVGQEYGVTKWVHIDQARIDMFAQCSGDDQWIHTDEKRAARGSYGKTIAQGFLLVSMAGHFVKEFKLVPEGAKMAINYGLNKVRMLNPVQVGSKIRDRMVLTQVRQKFDDRILVGTQHTIEIQGQNKPACVFEYVVMYVV